VYGIHTGGVVYRVTAPRYLHTYTEDLGCIIFSREGRPVGIMNSRDGCDAQEIYIARVGVGGCCSLFSSSERSGVWCTLLHYPHE
jgi:hypothetical protein